MTVRLVPYAGYDRTEAEVERLAEAIRGACERKGYDIRLRSFSPRAEIEKRNFVERSLEIAQCILNLTGEQ